MEEEAAKDEPASRRQAKSGKPEGGAKGSKQQGAAGSQGSGAADRGQKEMLITMQKAQLQTMQIQRQLVGSEWDFRLVPAKSLEVRAAVKAGAEYDRIVSEKEIKPKLLGSPHIQIAKVVVEELGINEGGVHGTTSRTQAAVAVMKLLNKSFEQNPGLVGEVFLHFRVKMAYYDESSGEGEQKAKVNVKFNSMAITPLEEAAWLEKEAKELGVEEFAKGPVTMRDIRRAFLELLEESGGEVSAGAPPRGPLEKALQADLRKLQIGGGKK